LTLHGNLSVSQNLWLTGGTLSLNSSLDYLTQLGTSHHRQQFMSVPLVLTLNQPLFSVNATKWNRRIVPVRYREAQARFLTATE
ncbi:hypothetical protein RFZ44_03125, partial [Acinetobacter sp. 163]|nr:hypothetical protein [Acinetobacter sp. 163]